MKERGKRPLTEPIEVDHIPNMKKFKPRQE